MPRKILEYIAEADTVVWDWNGTLLDDLNVVLQTEALHFAHYGMEAPSLAKRNELFCFPVEQYYERLGFDFSRHSYADVHRHFMKIYEERMAEARLFSGMRELLNEISEMGKRQFVLSAAPQAHLEEHLVKLEIAPLFAGIYGLADSGAASKLGRGQDLVREHNFDPTRTLMIGDTAHDHEVGIALGFQVLLVADGHKPYESLSALHHQVLRSRYSTKT